MGIGIILICLFLQQILLFDWYTYQVHWLETYFTWMTRKVEYITQGHAIAGLLILLIPVIIIFNLLFILVYHLGGVPLYFILNLILLWLCMDGRNLIKKPYINASVEQLFVLTFERLFAVIFWFLIFGPAGLILYSAVIALRNFLQRQNHTHLLIYTILLKNIMDWAPTRLLALSFAIVGNFSSVSRIIRLHFRADLSSNLRIIIESGSAALGLTENALSGHAFEVVNLINRALLFWLITIGLLTTAFYI